MRPDPVESQGERALLDLITAPGFSVEKLRQWKLTH